MNKNELIGAISEKAGVSKKDAGEVIGAFIEVVKEQLKARDSISMVGFGTFKTADRAARTARNPKTGADIQIPAKTVPVFKFGKGVKEVL
ncbi:MAG: HU family DNA-binding protein [Calditrichia bacterium]|nr:HU family DNA-binding protein [Calditrichia bacterium]